MMSKWLGVLDSSILRIFQVPILGEAACFFTSGGVSSLQVLKGKLQVLREKLGCNPDSITPNLYLGIYSSK